MNYWLMKTEPNTFSIDDLRRAKVEPWSGVRNFAARNNMRAMEKGDLILFYHSSCPQAGVYGISKVANVAKPDETQFDKNSLYYDRRANKEKPVWFCVDVEFVEAFARPVLLQEIKFDPKLSSMILVKRSRLSVQPVSEVDFKHICATSTKT